MDERDVSSVAQKEIQVANSDDWKYLCQNPESLNELPKDAILSIGFGIDASVPLRAISYPLLALQLLQDRPDLTLEMYVATQFSQLLGVDQDLVLTNSQVLKQTVNQFIGNFFPTLASRARFVPTGDITEKRLSLLNAWVKILQKDRELVDFAQARSGKDSLLYMAAHALYMRDPLPIDPSDYIVSPPEDERSVVMIGGEGEKIMWQARKRIIEKLDGVEPIQIFTTLGRTPPYFKKDEEPEVGDEVSLKFLMGAIPEVYRDYAATLVIIAKSMGNDAMSFKEITMMSRRNFLAQEDVQLALMYLNDFSRG